jgi:hypothetical protein
MLTSKDTMPVGLLVLTSGLTCCAASPLIGWHARRESAASVGEMLGVEVERACVGATGEGGRWYFAVAGPLSESDRAGLDRRLTLDPRDRSCNEPLRGHGNPTLEDPPSWFDWQVPESEVLDRCYYRTRHGHTAVTILSDHRILVAHRDDGDDTPGWLSDDLLQFYGHFCE